MKQTKKKNADAEARRRERADRFWGAFLFTENGKPKSSLMVYTFCLSFVFAAVYVLCYEGAIRLLTASTAAWPVWASNMLISATASVVGAAVCCLPHRFFKDKRLVFGGHMWLVLYALAVLATMLILLRGTEGTGAFLTLFGWFVAIPVALGAVVSGWLYRKDYRPEEPAEPEPEWKKYVNRR